MTETMMMTLWLSVVSVSAGWFICRWNILRTAKFKWFTELASAYVCYHIRDSSIIGDGVWWSCSSSKEWSLIVRRCCL